MSFVGSSQVPMKKLLLRRNTFSAEAEDDEAPMPIPTDLTTSNSSIPVADQHRTVHPAPSHKRKQSDALVLSGLDISADVVKSTYSSLSPIEQGTATDVEDATFTTATESSSRQLWKNILSPLLSSYQLITLFVIIATIITLNSVRSRGIDKNLLEEPYIYENEGSDEIGEPLEAALPKQVEEELLEFYSSPDRMPLIKSGGPWRVDPKIGGLHKFQNVCVTNNIDAPKPPELDTSSRGLIYFTQDGIGKNPKRCVPCSKKEMNNRVEDRWDAKSNADSKLGHRCGMKGLHAMFAQSVADYNTCMEGTDNHKSMIRARQNQTPSHVKQIRFFSEPTFLLQFDAHDKERSLFDMLMTYLPHWYKFKSEGGYPFQSVISHSVEGCLTHSRNWFCELTHQMTAFGYANEIPWEKNESTLYCYQTLYYNQLEYQRDLKHEGLITKVMVDEFRDELFKNMALPGPRDMSEVRKKDAKIGLKRQLNIALYSGEDNKWKGLDKLVSNAKSLKKYHGIEFNLIESFDDLSVAEQATAFNLADAVVMASGQHFANSIFSPDDTYFVEVGCTSQQSLTTNPHFMALILGRHQHISKCVDGSLADNICVSCSDGASFNMTREAFNALIDDIVKQHEQNISFQSDS